MLGPSPLGVACLMSSGGGSRAAPAVYGPGAAPDYVGLGGSDLNLAQERGKNWEPIFALYRSVPKRGSRLDAAAC
jgi:hypothetical protein